MVTIFFGSKAVSPIIFADAFQGRIKYKNKPVLSTEAKDAEFHTSMVSAIFPSFIIPVFALPAVMLSDDSLETHMTAAAPRASGSARGVLCPMFEAARPFDSQAVFIKQFQSQQRKLT